MEKVNFDKMSDAELQAYIDECEHLATVYNVSQLVKKILLNSLYGAIGSPFFKYYVSAMAEAITTNGQAVIRKTGFEINKFLNETLGNNENREYMVYGDTDSVYFEFKDVFDKYANPEWSVEQQTDFFDKVCKRVEDKCISPLCEKIHHELNCNKDNKALHMDREVLCVGFPETGHCGFWTGKKRYALFVNDSEGYRYDEAHMKIMGLSCVQSSTPEICRKDIENSISILIKHGDKKVREYANKTKDIFMSKTPEDIALPRSVSYVDRYVDKKTVLGYAGEWYDTVLKAIRNGGVPIQSTAAINYNYMLKKLGLEKKYETIKDGDKLKFVYLKRNPQDFRVIGFPDVLPEEFGLHKYIDYDTMFEKAYEKAVDDILIACGSSLEEKASVAEFF